MTNPTDERRARALEDFVDELRKWWSFDSNQQHTHSWHAREDFIQYRLPELLQNVAPDEAAGLATYDPRTHVAVPIKTVEFWWCSECRAEIDGGQVTYEEHHETCGARVNWITRAMLAALGGKEEG